MINKLHAFCNSLNIFIYDILIVNYNTTIISPLLFYELSIWKRGRYNVHLSNYRSSVYYCL